MIRKTCKGCIYHRTLSRADRCNWACRYMYDTGKKRGCPASDCTKKKLGKKKRTQIAIQ